MVERAESGRRPGLGLAQDRVDLASARRPVGRPARRSSAASPTSVSQQPTDPQRQAVPFGLTGMWPTSPP